MTGAYIVRVRNSQNNYRFTVKRNITILCGDSGTGKTTLFEMVADHNRYGKNSNVHITCAKDIVALTGIEWRERLGRIDDSIVIIDEDNDFVLTHEFARMVRNSNNYFILETRDYIPSLPYSVDEIYELRGDKNKRFHPVYTGRGRMYDSPRRLPFRPDMIITEDSRSGFQFFEKIARQAGMECVSAEGKAKIYPTIRKYPDKNVVVVADGAAFGAEIREIVKQQRLTPNKLAIFLPESFEWLILDSGVVTVERARIDQAEDYADSRLYMSWEQYFLDVLQAATQDVDYMRYKKAELAEFYLQDRNIEKVKDRIKGLKWDG